MALIDAYGYLCDIVFDVQVSSTDRANHCISDSVASSGFIPNIYKLQTFTNQITYSYEQTFFADINGVLDSEY
jgi:hypothetical protein